MQTECCKLEANWQKTRILRILSSPYTPDSLRVFNYFEGQQVWRNKNYGKHPRGKNEEGTQLGSDQWGTEWKHHAPNRSTAIRIRF